MIPVHPFAELFPMLSDADGSALRADIGARGQRERIIILDGQILDGRNRQQQLEALGLVDGNLPPDGDDLWLSRYRRFLPGQDGDPLAFVLSLNLHRRHLNDTQRGLIAARIANMRSGARTDLSSERATPRLNLDEVPETSLGEAADALHVSRATAANARKALREGAPELVERMDRGEVSASAGAQLATLPVGEQLRILREQHPREFGKAVREQRAKTQLLKKERRVEREADLGARQVALPDKRYGVILADPEWQFVTYSADTGMDRSADNHYPTSPTSVIASRPVGDIAADDCVLFLWATVPMLLEGGRVLEAWGFTYKSNFNWHKDRIGTGYWNRNRHEHLLIGTRGKLPAPAMGDQFDSSIEAAVGAHSSKPDIFYEIIEAYFPSLPKIELNARARRAGWDAWGLEAPAETHAASEAIAMSFEQAEPILRARYATSSGAELSAITGRPIGTIKTWAHRLGLTSHARLAGNAAHLGEHLKTKESTK